MAKIADNALKRIAGLDPFPLPKVIPTRYPVVLMHGFGLLAGLRRGGHLKTAAEHLRLRGVRAFAPNVAPYNTVAFRSRMWLSRIEQAMEQARTDRITLIAHSMGGLDARWLISQHGLGDRVTALVTVATPHRGSAVADYIASGPERLGNWLTEVANWMGTTLIQDGEADFRTAIRELTPANIVENFNPHVVDDPRVRYWSYAGVAGRGCDHSINPLLRPFNNYLYDREGRNDGLVSEESARWAEFLGDIPADHMQQIGGSFPGSSGFDHAEFYASLATMLADSGF